MSSAFLSSSGSFKNTMSFLNSIVSRNIFDGLDSLAQQGVDALASVTPIDTGLTASSWSYEIESDSSTIKIYWLNNHVDGTANVAVLLEYGHGTGTGGYVPGYDYINPAIQPIFDQIAESVWKRVTTA